MSWAGARRFAPLALSLIAFAVYVGAVIDARFSKLTSKYVVDGDQFQAVFHYQRYHEAGFFPPGELFTDFAFVMHAPPLWWLLMATLSSFITPLAAAKALNLVAWLGATAAMYAVVRSRSNHWLGLAAAALLVRNPAFHQIIAGGYARSFGPVLVLTFLYFFLQHRHRACLLLLVVQAALYPSVVIPCGITYGVFVLLRGPTWAARRRRIAEMFVTGLIVIGFGLFQDLARPDWWGPVVTLEEASQMRAWHRPKGRFKDLPLEPHSFQIARHLGHPFFPTGKIVAPASLARASAANHFTLPLLPSAVCLLLLGARRLALRRRRAEAPGSTDSTDLPEPSGPTELPWQIPALAGGALAGYFLAHLLAFRLYVPYRVLGHTLAYLVTAAVVLAPWLLARSFSLSRARATVLALVVGVLPAFAIAGTGIGNDLGTYHNYKRDRGLWSAVRKLPQEAIISGPIYVTDRVPLLSKHRVRSNRNLCQPFRKGIYDECERRLRETYEALYATDLQTVADYGARESVDYLVFEEKLLQDKLDKRLFEPVRQQVTAAFERGRREGFALLRVPAAAVVWRGKRHAVVDLARLREVLATTTTP